MYVVVVGFIFEEIQYKRGKTTDRQHVTHQLNGTLFVSTGENRNTHNR